MTAGVELRNLGSGCLIAELLPDWRDQIRVSDWTAFDYAEADGIGTITFSRPERLNSLTFDTYAQLRDLTAELRRRPDEIRVLVIRGSGRGFCSGGDVDEIIGELVNRDTRDVYEFAQMTGSVIRNLREMPQVVIAAVNGIAAGAGAVIASAADLRIVNQSASFRFLFTSVGLSGGDMGICWLLPRLVGFGRATELLMFGDKLTAEDALRMGLANRIVEDDRLDAEVEAVVQRLIALAPWGLAMTKDMLNRAASLDYSTAIEIEAWTQSLLMRSGDFVEFRESFRDKRSPVFDGR
jgi:enoyl-CoA hydratase/carnithine racemase